MSTIESVLQETRVFPPSRSFVKQANVSGHGRLPGAVRRGRARLRGLLGAARARERALVASRSPRCSTSRTRRSSSGSTTASSTPRTTASTGTCKTPARQGRDHLRGRRRQGDEGHLQGALPPRLPVRQRAEGATASRRASASSSTCRCRSRPWSRCRPARASARRTRWCSAASPPRACRSASSTPARSR